MRKTTPKKLGLETRVLRLLSEVALEQTAGGAITIHQPCATDYCGSAKLCTQARC